MKFRIKSRYSSNCVVYECDLADGTQNAMLAALIKAVAERADLRNANLRDSDLNYANLSYSDLRDSDLSYSDLRNANLRDSDLNYANLSYSDLRDSDLSNANLRGADLSYADLRYADLRGADLSHSNLRGAYLSGADMGENKLVGERPYFSIGPIGSRQDNLTLWITDKGPLLKTGCFGPVTFDDFRKNLERDHEEGSAHRREYEAALLLCEAHAQIWTPA